MEWLLDVYARKFGIDFVCVSVKYLFIKKQKYRCGISQQTFELF